jgi:hypothetical protein
MEKTAMTYNQAVQNGYEDQVKAVAAVPPDYSGRTAWPGKQDGMIEFTASHTWTDQYGHSYTITAHYYQDEDDMPEDGDLGSLDWTPWDFEVF